METELTGYTKLIEDGWTFDMAGLIHAYELHTDALTQRDANHIFQLSPVPDKPDDINEFILTALRTKDLRYFFIYLHFFEKRLGRIIRRRQHDGGDFRYDPERLVDIKLTSMEVMLNRLPHYDPSKQYSKRTPKTEKAIRRAAAFSTYVYRFILDAVLLNQYYGCGYSVETLSAYRTLRRAIAVYNSSSSKAEAAQKITEQSKVSPGKAMERVEGAQTLFGREPMYAVYRDDEEEVSSAEDATSVTWDYVEILSDDVHAATLRRAFDELDEMEQELISRHLSICMTCGRAGSSKGATFENLALLYEMSSASGAERAYKRGLNKLAVALVEAGELHGVKLHLAKKTGIKNITAAVYKYQADCDGEWGEIHFDFVQHTAEIVELADWDTSTSNIFAKRVIEHILAIPLSTLPKDDVIVFEKRALGYVAAAGRETKDGS